VRPEINDKTAYSELNKPIGKLSDYDTVSVHKNSTHSRPLTPPKELFYDDKYDL